VVPCQKKVSGEGIDVAEGYVITECLSGETSPTEAQKEASCVNRETSKPCTTSDKTFATTTSAHPCMCGKFFNNAITKTHVALQDTWLNTDSYDDTFCWIGKSTDQLDKFNFWNMNKYILGAIHMCKKDEEETCIGLLDTETKRCVKRCKVDPREIFVCDPGDICACGHELCKSYGYTCSLDETGIPTHAPIEYCQEGRKCLYKDICKVSGLNQQSDKLREKIKKDQINHIQCTGQHLFSTDVCFSFQDESEGGSTICNVIDEYVQKDDLINDPNEMEHPEKLVTMEECWTECKAVEQCSWWKWDMMNHRCIFQTRNRETRLPEDTKSRVTEYWFSGPRVRRTADHHRCFKRIKTSQNKPTVYHQFPKSLFGDYVACQNQCNSDDNCSYFLFDTTDTLTLEDDACFLFIAANNPDDLDRDDNAEAKDYIYGPKTCRKGLEQCQREDKNWVCPLGGSATCYTRDDATGEPSSTQCSSTDSYTVVCLCGNSSEQPCFHEDTSFIPRKIPVSVIDEKDGPMIIGLRLLPNDTEKIHIGAKCQEKCKEEPSGECKGWTAVVEQPANEENMFVQPKMCFLLRELKKEAMSEGPGFTSGVKEGCRGVWL
jgi:hypothetical protein